MKKVKRIESPEFYNVGATANNVLNYKYVFKGRLLKCKFQDNGRNCLSDLKYFSWCLN